MTRARGAVLLLLAMALAGCASTKGIAPTGQARTVESLGASPASPVDWPRDQWWNAFRDPVLDGLVARALADSPTLAGAQARLARAQSAVDNARAAQLPQVNAEADITRQRFSERGLFPPPLGGSAVTLNTVQLSGNWELDFFGRERAALQAALSAERASAAEQQAARVLLATAVARSYMQLARLGAQREVGLALRKDSEQVLRLVQARVNNGLDTMVELRQAEGTVPQINQQLEAIDEQMALTRHALAALIGAAPQDTDALAPALPAEDDIGWTAAPPLIPADLVGRRADVVAARWRVEAAARAIDVARAEFYPNINLAAFVGFSSLSLSHWIENGSQVWGIGPALHLPVFDGGHLRANLRGRSADFDAAVASYNGALIEAVHDVADQLSSLQSIERQAREQEAAQRAAESAFELATLRYRAGLGTFLTVLSAENNVLTQRRSGVDLRARAIDARIQLVRALGGGYAEAHMPQEAAAQSAGLATVH